MQGLAKQAILFSSVNLDAIVAAAAFALYDPSDITSLGQENTGQTAVASDGDAVGLMLDKKSMGGMTAAAFIAAQPELRANGATTLFGSVTPATYDTATGAGVVPRVDSSNLSGVTWTGLAAAALYAIDITVGGAGSVYIKFGAVSASVVSVTLTAGRYTVFVGASAGAVTITSQINGTSATFTVHSFKAVPGYHRAQSTGTKRPFYKTTGGLKSLLYDGMDDCLPTATTVDLTGTDTVTLSMAVRKTSDAAFALLAEFSATTSSNNGAFSLSAPGTALNNYGWRSKGTAASDAIIGTYTSPVTNVLTGLGGISTDTSILRINGVQAQSSASDQGTGNFGNFTLNFGGRNNGASAAFTGNEYGSILKNALADAAALTLFETWANTRAKAY